MGGNGNFLLCAEISFGYATISTIAGSGQVMLTDEAARLAVARTVLLSPYDPCRSGWGNHEKVLAYAAEAFLKQLRHEKTALPAVSGNGRSSL